MPINEQFWFRIWSVSFNRSCSSWHRHVMWFVIFVMLLSRRPRHTPNSKPNSIPKNECVRIGLFTTRIIFAHIYPRETRSAFLMRIALFFFFFFFFHSDLHTNNWFNSTQTRLSKMTWSFTILSPTRTTHLFMCFLFYSKKKPKFQLDNISSSWLFLYGVRLCMLYCCIYSFSLSLSVFCFGDLKRKKERQTERETKMLEMTPPRTRTSNCRCMSISTKWTQSISLDLLCGEHVLFYITFPYVWSP